MAHPPTEMQLTLFGPPEPSTSYPATRSPDGGASAPRDDLPVACERELLWPASLVTALMDDGLEMGAAVGVLERLYGDIPRRTRLRTVEVCRRLRCDSNVVYRHRESGDLPAVDVSAGAGDKAEWRFYRAGLVIFLATREFGPVPTRTDATRDDMQRLSRAVARMRQ